MRVFALSNFGTDRNCLWFGVVLKIPYNRLQFYYDFESSRPFWIRFFRWCVLGLKKNLNHVHNLLHILI